jgi:positive regulator of sigma E activity
MGSFVSVFFEKRKRAIIYLVSAAARGYFQRKLTRRNSFLSAGNTYNCIEMNADERTERVDEGYALRKGVVLSAGDGRLVVRVRREEDGECGGCVACSLKSLCGGRGTAHIDLPVAAPEGAAYSPGDAVTVSYRPPNAALAAAVMFVPALAGLALGGWLAHASGWGDGMLILACLAGFGAGVGVSWLVSLKGRGGIFKRTAIIPESVAREILDGRTQETP